MYPQIYLGLVPAPASTLHSRTWGERPSWERNSLLPHACFSHSQVHTCKDGHVGLGGIKGAPSLPAQLLTLLLQRSYLGAEEADSWNLGVLEAGPIASSHSPSPTPLLAFHAFASRMPVSSHQTIILGSPPSLPWYPVAAAHGAEGVCSTGKECLRVPGNKNTDVVVAFVLENPKF